MLRRFVPAAAALLLALSAATAAAVPPTAPAAPQTKAPSDEHVSRPAVSDLAARALGPAGEMRGMALNDMGVRTLPATIPDFPRMAAAGITSVTVYVYLYVSDPTGTTVTTGLHTPTDAELDAVAQAAHLNGMDLHLMPVLLDTDTRGWRGRYFPSDLNAFFASYTERLVYYADLAQRTGATLFYVGSENERIAGKTAYWRGVINSVRQHYSGALSYMSTPYTAKNVRFWDALDLAGISAYFSMGADDNPTYERYLAAWNQVHTPFVRALARAVRKPLVYSEVGYYAQQQAFANPAEKPETTKMPAPAAQADGYRALLDVLKDEPSVYGVTWWRWAPAGTPADTAYSPNGKPAECVIAAHWSPYPDVRTAASAPVCDLHAFDAALATVGQLIPR